MEAAEAGRKQLWKSSCVPRLPLSVSLGPVKVQLFLEWLSEVGQTAAPHCV